MDTVNDELDPPDLLSSVSTDSSSNSAKVPSIDIDDQVPSVNIEDAELVFKINNLHCPFIWNPEDSLKSYNGDSVEEVMNVDEIFDEASGFKLRKFVIHLILCYNNFKKRLLEKSLRNLDEMEKMLLTSMKNRSQDVYFTQIGDALFHILNSCRVVMFHSTNQKEKARQVMQKITPYEALNPTNRAGIWAVRANLYVEFGYDGIKAAIQYIERSIDIDDNNPYWHFTRGMYLGRLRRMESGLAIPSRDEILSLELAMKLKEDASFMAFAAEVYVETVNRSKKKTQNYLTKLDESERRKLEEQNNMINDRAAKLFKKSVELNRNCAHVLFRCGKGMIKLAPPYQDLGLARKYLEKGLEISYESSFGNHAMAMYYMKHENNYEMAQKYLVKATQSKNFGADIDLIRLNFLVNRNTEALLDSLLKLFDRYSDKMRHRKILAEVISYYLFIEYNLMEVINYMKKLVYLIGDHDDIISVYKSGILRIRFPVSLLEITLSDITDRSRNNKLNDDEKKECFQFMEKICFQNVTLPRPKSGNLRKDLLKEIKASFEKVNVGKVNRSLTRTTEKHPRKDYNPAEQRFEKEYAQKYYAEEEPNRNEKTVVDEFFEKYEAQAALSVEKVESSSSIEKKSPNADKFDPIIQKLFTKMKDTRRKDDSSNEFSEGDEEIMNDIAKRLDFHLSISARSESKRTKTLENGASTSHRSDTFDDASAHRRRPSRSPRKRSRSRESRRAGRDSSYKRSDSKESYRSTKESHRKRSLSTESRYSTRHSHRRRSPSRESRRKRSPSVESNVSYRRSKGSGDRKSSRRRSNSRESKYSVKSNRRRSTSRDRRSTSKDVKQSRERSESKESDRAHKKRSVSRERRPSPKVKSSRRKRSVSKEQHRRRSASQESRLSLKSEHSHRKRSVSKESTRKRSMSRESHRSSSRRKRSTSRESRISSKPGYSHRKRSVSKESVQKRSASRESHHSSSRRKRSTSRDSRLSSKPEHSHRRRSVSKDSARKRSTSRESRRPLKSDHHRRERSISRESDKEHRRKKSPTPEKYRSSKSEKYQRKRSISNESHRSNKEPRQKSEIKESSQSTKRGTPVLESSDSKPIATDNEKSLPPRDRSRSRESRRSRSRSPRPERKNRSTKSKKHESDNTLTEFSSNEADYEHRKSKKSYRSDRYQKDHRDYLRRPRPRSYSSDETRSIRSRRSSSKESRRSKRNSSRDRRDDYRRKRDEKKYRKYSSSEDSSSYSSSGSESSNRDNRKSSRHRKSSRDEDFEMKNKSKKDNEKSENQVADKKVGSPGPRSVEKQNDLIRDNKSDPENDAQPS